jgi:hypothetical protein
MKEAAKSNCHMLTLSNLEFDRVQTASMPAAAHPHYILPVKGLEILAFVLGLFRWSASHGPATPRFASGFIAHVQQLFSKGQLVPVVSLAVSAAQVVQDGGAGARGEG